LSSFFEEKFGRPLSFIHPSPELREAFKQIGGSIHCISEDRALVFFGSGYVELVDLAAVDLNELVKLFPYNAATMMKEVLGFDEPEKVILGLLTN